ncbi:MAG: sulfite exporter TauE/SafE family protein, partial [Vicinamibacteraceae bacterium]
GRGLAVVAGCLLLAGLMGRTGVLSRSHVTARIGVVVSRGLIAVRSGVGAHPLIGGLFVGSLNGLLPCTLVYAALAAATALGEPVRAAAFMLLFGLGTIPSLALVSAGSARLSPHLRGRLTMVTPLALGVLAVLLIARGLSVGAAAHGMFHQHHP